MRTYQSITILGRVGQAPIVRNSSSKIVSISLATSRSFKPANSTEWQEETTWHNCTTFGTIAERAEKFQKGDLVLVVGEIRTRKYTGNDGVERTVYEVHAHSVQLMDRKTTDAPTRMPQESPERPFEFGNTYDDLPF